MPLPDLSPEQRQAALKKAAEARRRRAEIKAKLKSGSLGMNDVLRQSGDDETLGKMKVSAMLEALPGVGKVRAKSIMEELNISPTRRLRGLGDKQKEALRERFGQ